MMVAMQVRTVEHVVSRECRELQSILIKLSSQTKCWIKTAGEKFHRYLTGVVIF